tara:strand:+ start:156 stop:734 length:579 start_codon:yes stop_codon:yes gene_type:complete
MDTTNIQRYLDSFAKNVVTQAQLKLNKDKGNTALGQSIRSEVVTDDKGFSVNFYMDDYGTFLDKGVSGNEKQRSYTNTKGETVPSPYQYTNKQPPTTMLEVWIKKKGLKGRKSLIKHRKGDAKKKKVKGAGQFITDKSFAFAIAKSIQRKGIRSLSFFQQPVGVNYEILKRQLLGEVKTDIETYLVSFYRPK